MKICIAQLNIPVGDIWGNAEKIVSACADAKSQNAELVVFPELAITGYPPEDLLLRPEFCRQEMQALEKAAAAIDIPAIIGATHTEDGKLFNAAYLLENGKAKLVALKTDLPTYGVFDEGRYFKSSELAEPTEILGKKVGILICEDSWTLRKALIFKEKGAEALVIVNASPFEIGKLQRRYKLMQDMAENTQLPVTYVNMTGGHDELIFEGGSFQISAQGKLIASLPQFEEMVKIPDELHKPLEIQEARYKAIILGLRDYVQKNGFQKVLLGLSGGIDSALVVALAVDALGKENVRGVMLPSRYTSQQSLDDARAIADNLQIKLDNIPIEDGFQALESSLSTVFSDKESDITEENMQSRIRGVILMAISNKFHEMLLTTGNKSELAVGYSTLYGDSCGGYAPIKDLYKTEVYELVNWRNQHISDDIPQAVIDRAPTAELRHDQTDQDSLPPYDKLDDILKHLIEEKRSIEAIVNFGHDREVVEKVRNMLYFAQYKRYQSAP